MVKEYTAEIPNVESNEQDLRLVITRPDQGDKITIYLLGSENPGAIRGIYLDGVVIDEFAEQNPSVWSQVVRPTLSDRAGWALFIGTPKAQNHFWDIYEHAKKDPTNWYRALFKASETGILPDSELREARATMPLEDYEQEYECSFTSAMVGAFYAKYIQEAKEQGRVINVPYEPMVPVDTFWDIGISDATAIWFRQLVGKEERFIDYLEGSSEGLEWYVKEMQKRGYVYGEHVLPHDATARELGSGKTRVEMLQGLSLGRIRVAPKASIEDGINAVRMVLPKCWFDEKKCEKGLKALSNYQSKWDEKNKILTTRPLHDWSSHAADAMRTFAMAARGSAGRIKPEDLKQKAEMDWDVFS